MRGFTDFALDSTALSNEYPPQSTNDEVQQISARLSRGERCARPAQGAAGRGLVTSGRKRCGRNPDDNPNQIRTQSYHSRKDQIEFENPYHTRVGQNRGQAKSGISTSFLVDQILQTKSRLGF